ncbi:MAG: hypothetical protein LBH22_03180 [Bacteroidales bacterium]|jgi:hypothetical protein|nr:hypothetical protein [Bacteroidales bacterium]
MKKLPKIITQNFNKKNLANKKNSCNFAKRFNQRKEATINEKIGDWLMDVAKYIVTAIIITSFLGSFGEPWKVYVLGISIAFASFIVGIFYINKKL